MPGANTCIQAISLTSGGDRDTSDTMPSTLVPDTTDHRPTVLIVDDEAAPRAALTQILQQDFHILTADTARAALAVLDDHGVDLVTLDLKLPDRSGSDLLHDIKRAHAEIEVIMVTAYGSLQSAMDCIRHGAAGFLLKPFNASELLAISLQTAQKKLRLDQLRPVLTNSTTLWGPEPACTKAWQALVDDYTTMNRTGSLSASHSDETSPLVPLISDLLEAKDRHLLNHGSRVSFYSTLVANRLSLPIAEQQSLALGALVHDLDLISVLATRAEHGIRPADPSSRPRCEDGPSDGIISRRCADYRPPSRAMGRNGIPLWLTRRRHALARSHCRHRPGV